MTEFSDLPTATGEAEDFRHDVLARALPDGIFVLEGDLRIVYASPALQTLFGYPHSQMLGQDLLTLFPEWDRQTVRTHLADVRHGRSEPLLGVGYRADGSELEVEVRATALDLHDKHFLVGAVRDVTERQRQAKQAAALAQAACSAAAGESIDAVLEAISKCALAGTRALAAWVTLDSEDCVAAWFGAAGVPDGFRERVAPAVTVAANCSVFLQALAARQVVIYTDARQLVERELGTAGVANALKSLPWQTAAFAQLLHRGAAVGLLTAIYRKGEIPCAAETTFLAALAAQAATVAANAQLLAAAREKVALEERQRLARELHDSVCQSLYAIQLGAQMARQRLDQDPAGAAEPIDYVMRLAEASQAQMRALIFELRPESLESEGLVAAINRQLEAVQARKCISVQTVASAEPKLPLEAKLALYRIAQEALWNTVKHARARRVDVRLETAEAWVVLEIADDGVGFDPDASLCGGLHSMDERATALGGSLEIISAPGRGTRIVVRIPSMHHGQVAPRPAT
jgi:PAS domain S-box-containing protein